MMVAKAKYRRGTGMPSASTGMGGVLAGIAGWFGIGEGGRQSDGAPRVGGLPTLNSLGILG